MGRFGSFDYDNLGMNGNAGSPDIKTIISRNNLSIERDGQDPKIKYNGATIAYDDPVSIKAKCDWAKDKGMIGWFAWEASGDRSFSLAGAASDSFGIGGSMTDCKYIKPSGILNHIKCSIVGMKGTKLGHEGCWDGRVSGQVPGHVPDQVPSQNSGSSGLKDTSEVDIMYQLKNNDIVIKKQLRNNNENYSILDILPRNSRGEEVWIKIFPEFARDAECIISDPTRSGCKLLKSGPLQGLGNFIDAAVKFPKFCNGPDLNKNKRELAAFFANVYQETGCGISRIDGRHCEISEVSNDNSSFIGGYFGRGPLQITYEINYAQASRGVKNNKWDWWDPGDLKCSSLGNSIGAPPPAGIGANICNENRKKLSTDPVLSWMSAIWYWVNRPMSADAIWGNNNFKE